MQEEQNINHGHFIEVGERPWGKYYVIEDQPTYKVKRIEVLPGKRLSLQSHNQRSEHWVVVQGTATVEVQIGSDTNRWVKNLSTWESTFVPQGTKHRLSNQTDQILVIVEVQCGNYTGEDDIIRYEDDFNRVQIS